MPESVLHCFAPMDLKPLTDIVVLDRVIRPAVTVRAVVVKAMAIVVRKVYEELGFKYMA